MYDDFVNVDEVSQPRAAPAHAPEHGLSSQVSQEHVRQRNSVKAGAPKSKRQREGEGTPFLKREEWTAAGGTFVYDGAVIEKAWEGYASNHEVWKTFNKLAAVVGTTTYRAAQCKVCNREFLSSSSLTNLLQHTCFKSKKEVQVDQAQQAEGPDLLDLFVLMLAKTSSAYNFHSNPSIVREH